MAKKQTMMPMPTGGGTGKRALVALAALVLLALVIRDPAGTASTARQLATGAGVALDGLATFVRILAG